MLRLGEGVVLLATEVLGKKAVRENPLRKIDERFCGGVHDAIPGEYCRSLLIDAPEFKRAEGKLAVDARNVMALKV
ncbi:hypothetical protein ALDI51_15910 [Alicycliphilus denitrificans]|nr:hypothetical protein ALDI51_15910 [Alicycliphilus denitrificans]